MPTGLGPWAHLSLPPLPPALRLLRQEGPFPEQCQRLSLGCPVLDVLLRGGLPLDGITELAGRSSAGKTQLALQLCLQPELCHSWKLHEGFVVILRSSLFWPINTEDCESL